VPAVTPTLCSAIANRLYAYRWWFLACSVISIGLFTAAMAVVPSSRMLAVGGALLGPLVAGPWALLCASVWFHPRHGNLQPASRLVGWLPAPLQSAIRWYAAVFLLLFLVVGAVVVPLLSLTQL
jgi:hypothetical protein